MGTATRTRQGLRPARAIDRRAAVRFGVIAVELALAGLVAVLAARLVWFLAFGADIDRLDAALAEPGAGPQRAEASIDLSALSAGTLFAARSAGEAGPAIETAPETDLDLVLRGVRRTGDPRAGSAIIQTSQGEQRIIPVGGEIAPNVTLEAIYPDRVIIDRRGARESLSLREDARRTTLLRASGQPREAVEATPTPAPAATRAPARRFGEDDWLRGLRLERLEPGSAGGYRIRPDSDRALLESVGLEPGDVITSVNGRTITRTVNMAAVLENLAEASSARFTVLRDGRTRTIEVNLR